MEGAVGDHGSYSDSGFSGVQKYACGALSARALHSALSDHAVALWLPAVSFGRVPSDVREVRLGARLGYGRLRGPR